MKDVVLEWNGVEYRVSGDRAFDLGEQIEDIAPLSELDDLRRGPKFHKIARIYATMLRFAGAPVKDHEVWSQMMAQTKALTPGGDASGLIAAHAINAFMEILMDGAPVSSGGEPAKKESASSKPPIKRR